MAWTIGEGEGENVGYRVRLDSKIWGVTRIVVFFQAEDGIRDYKVTGVQTCALPICAGAPARAAQVRRALAVRPARGRHGAVPPAPAGLWGRGHCGGPGLVPLPHAGRPGAARRG